jgi:hypothetical protein
LTLGCLLGLELCRKGNRLTVGDREATPERMDATERLRLLDDVFAAVVIEADLIRSVSLLLNLHQNDEHAFSSTLRACRAAGRAQVRK